MLYIKWLEGNVCHFSNLRFVQVQLGLKNVKWQCFLVLGFLVSLRTQASRGYVISLTVCVCVCVCVCSVCVVCVYALCVWCVCNNKFVITRAQASRVM